MNAARDHIEQIYRAAIAAVGPRACVRSALAYDDAGRKFVVGETAIDAAEGVYLIAFGKAGAAMALGAVDAFGDAVQAGIVVTKEPAAEPVDRFAYMVGSHPVPDERSLAAGEAVLNFAAQLPDGVPVLCLISGGGSALVEALRPGVELEDLQDVTSQLLKRGAPIHDLNAVRSRLSRIKGGGLLAALEHTRVINLIVSDVLGDDLHAIASGPTVEPDTSSRAEDVLARFDVDAALPEPAPGPPSAPAVTRIVANLEQAIDAAAIESGNLGYRPLLLADRLTGEAREVGTTLAVILRGAGHPRSPIQPGCCVLAGGETTVTVRGDGTGGRNTEAALAAALELCGTKGITVGFLATDGDDGTTEAAGAIVDGATISPDDVGRARAALRANDSFGFLSGTGAIWDPGATGTNVNDLVIAVVE